MEARMISPRSTSLGRVIPAASFRLLSGTNNGAAGFDLRTNGSAKKRTQTLAGHERSGKNEGAALLIPRANTVAGKYPANYREVERFVSAEFDRPIGSHNFNRLLLFSCLPIDFAPEPLFRLEIGGNSGATLSMYDFSLDPPRWPNGPQICSVVNLPAFETEAELDKFNAANGPSCKVDRKWLCEHCEGWHCDVTAPDPSGGSSGTGRSSKRSKKI